MKIKIILAGTSVLVTLMGCSATVTPVSKFSGNPNHIFPSIDSPTETTTPVVKVSALEGNWTLKCTATGQGGSLMGAINLHSGQYSKTIKLFEDESCVRLFAAQKDTDVSDHLLVPMILREKSAIEVSNLNAELAKNNPEYVQHALLGAYGFYMDKYSAGDYSNPEQIRKLIQHMHTIGVKFAITSGDPVIQRQASALGPHSIQTRYFNYTAPEVNIPEISLIKNAIVELREIKIHYFTVEQIINLLNSKPTAGDHSLSTMFRGDWASHYLLNDNNLF